MSSEKQQTNDTASKLWALSEYADLPARAVSVLLRRFETLDSICSAETSDIQDTLDVDEEFARRISEATERLPEAEAFLSRLPDRGIKIVTMFDTDYPAGLFELNDPPPLLFYRGTLPETGSRMVSLVGCSEPDSDGITVAVEFAKQVAAQDISLISGIYRGTNVAALIGSVGTYGDNSGATAGTESSTPETSANGRDNSESSAHNGTEVPSFALVACGLEAISPKEYSALAESISKRGAVISEYGPDVDPTPERYSDTNRLIVALSGAVVIGPVVSESEEVFDIAEACVEQGKIFFVLVAAQQLEVDRAALERLVSLGGIAVSFPDDLDTIIKCLV